jgi:hypothetical protein
MRLRPLPGVKPAGLWLAVATPQAQVQIKALSFGSVVDHMIASAVEGVWLPPVPPTAVAIAERAWADLVQARRLGSEAVALFEELLGRVGER